MYDIPRPNTRPNQPTKLTSAKANTRVGMQPTQSGSHRYQDLLKDEIGRNTSDTTGPLGYMALKSRGTYQQQLSNEPNYLIV